jgi:hypothetical protein
MNTTDIPAEPGQTAIATQGPEFPPPSPALGHFGCPGRQGALNRMGDPRTPESLLPRHGFEDEHSSRPDRASERGHRKLRLSPLTWVPAVRYRFWMLREESLDFRPPDSSLNKRFGRWSVCNFSSSSTVPTDR